MRPGLKIAAKANTHTDFKRPKVVLAGHLNSPQTPRVCHAATGSINTFIGGDRVAETGLLHQVDILGAEHTERIGKGGDAGFEGFFQDASAGTDFFRFLLQRCTGQMTVGQRVAAKLKDTAVDQSHLCIGKFGFSRQFASVVVGFFLYRPVVVVSVHDEVKRGLGTVLLQHRQGVKGIVLVAIIKGNRDLLAATKTSPS